MVVPTPYLLQETTNHEATAGEGQQRFRHCGLNLLQPEPRGMGVVTSQSKVRPAGVQVVLMSWVSNRAVLVHYTALWVLIVSPAMGGSSGAA